MRIRRVLQNFTYRQGIYKYTFFEDLAQEIWLPEIPFVYLQYKELRL